MKTFTGRDFADMFGTTKDDVFWKCGVNIDSHDFSYEECTAREREMIVIDILNDVEKGMFSVSGAGRLNDWRKGWAEVLKEFQSDGNLNTLIPKDLHPNRPMRYYGNYIKPYSPTFEHDFTVVFRNWLYKRWFKNFTHIYEFGCGTGQNLALLAKIFGNQKRLYGFDWAPESQGILKAIVDKYNWNITGGNFDMFNPPEGDEFPPSSLAYTSCAMEQMGDNFTPFLNYIIQAKPDLCVNVEPLIELYDENNIFDYVVLKYHRKRGYLNGFLARLLGLQKMKIIQILSAKRLRFGSLFHEGYMYVVWKVL